MRKLLTIIIMATTTSVLAQDGKATTIKKTFSRETRVQIIIKASPEIVWALLTNGSDYVRWNSTVTSLDGEIESGEKIRLKSTLDPKRTFKLKVKGLTPEMEMVWESGAAPFFKGKRVYSINPNNNSLTFTMTERLSGLMFPLAAGSIPSFDQNFEQFARDLKQEAETIQNSK